MNIRMNPRDGGFPKRPQMYFSRLKRAGFSGCEVKLSSYLRDGISTAGLIIVTISGSSSTFLFDSFGPEMNIRMNPRDGELPKRPKMYFSSLKRAGFAGCEVKLNSYLRDGISTAGLIIVIISGSSRTFLFDLFGPEMNIRMNPRDGGFPKRPKMYFSSLKRAGFAGCEVKLSSYLRDAGLKIVIISGSSSTFLFDSFGPEMNIRMNPRDGGFPKRPKMYFSSLKRAGFSGCEVKLSSYLRDGISTAGLIIVIISGSSSTFLFVSFGPEMNIRMNPRDGKFPKRPKMYFSSLKRAGFAGCEVKLSSYLRDGISTAGLIIVIISGSSSKFLFDSFGPEMNIRMNPRDGGFPKRPKMYFSSLKRAGFAGCEVKLSSYLRDGISTAGLIIVIFSGSSSTFLFDSFGAEMNIRMNPRDGGFPKRPKMYFSSLKRAGFAGCEVKLSSYLRDSISTAGLIIVIISGSSSAFLFDSFGPEMNIRMNPRDGGFPKRLKMYFLSLKRAGFAGCEVKLSSYRYLRDGISTAGLIIVIISGSSSTFLFDSFGPEKNIRMNPRDGGFPKRPKMYFSSLKRAGFAGCEVKVSSYLRDGISTAGLIIVIISGSTGLIIVIISGSSSTFLFNSFGPEKNIRINPRDGGFPKRPQMYFSRLKRAGFAGCEVNLSSYLRDGISTAGLIIVITSGPSSTFVFDSFGPEMNIRMNSRDGGFPKRPKMYFSSLKRAGFAGCEVKLSPFLRYGISIAGLIIVITSGPSSTFVFDSFGPEMNISMNPRVGGFPKRPIMYI
ncbi:hypothetical protein ACROYT_G000960 [Oculina patagonica]